MFQPGVFGVLGFLRLDTLSYHPSELTIVVEAVCFGEVDDSESVRETGNHTSHSEVEPLSVSLCENVRFQDQFVLKPTSAKQTAETHPLREICDSSKLLLLSQQLLLLNCF